MQSGRAALVRTPDDERILIDGGANSDIIRKLTEILPFYSKRIDKIIATTGEGRNVGGLIEVLNRYEVGEVILPTYSATSLGLVDSDDQIYRVFIDTLEKKGIPVKNVKAGDELLISDISDINVLESVKADILFPALPDNFAYSKSSAPEIVLRIIYDKTSFLLWGGATPKIQKSAANSRDRISALIVSNSATASNTAKQAIESWNPKYLIYSKSPSRSISDLSAKKEDPIASIPEHNRFNLKENGTVRIISDGSEIKIESMGR